MVPSYLIYEGLGNETASVRFTQAGNYPVYTYFHRLDKTASEIGITVSNGKTNKSMPIKPADIVVIGQTSGEWVSLGRFELPKGQTSSVDIVVKKADGSVVADAMRYYSFRHSDRTQKSIRMSSGEHTNR